MEANDALSEQIQQAADASSTSMAIERERRRNQIRRLLGFEDDLAAPAWVQRVHRRMIESFGSGNGRGR